MHVTLFDHFGAKNSAPVFAALEQGIESLGFQCSSHSMVADIAVIWSVVWAGRMKSNHLVWQSYRQTGRPVIVAEVGMLNRGITWKLGLNGTGIGSYSIDDLESDRAARLGITLAPWQQGNDIVIALQRTDSEQWAGQSLDWLQNTVSTLQKHSSRPIVIRPHPRGPTPAIYGCRVDHPVKIQGTYDNFNYDHALSNAWAVVNWNSGPGPQSILAGVPAFVGPDSLASPVGNTDLSKIETPVMPDRASWANQLAHTEWTTQELATGMPIKRLLSL